MFIIEYNGHYLRMDCKYLNLNLNRKLLVKLNSITLKLSGDLLVCGILKFLVLVVFMCWQLIPQLPGFLGSCVLLLPWAPQGLTC